MRWNGPSCLSIYLQRKCKHLITPKRLRGFYVCSGRISHNLVTNHNLTNDFIEIWKHIIVHIPTVTHLQFTIMLCEEGTSNAGISLAR